MEPEDKSLTEVVTIAFVNFLNEFKNRTLTKAVIDCFEKPFEPKFRSNRNANSEISEKRMHAKAKKQKTASGQFQPIKFVEEITRVLKHEREYKSNRQMNESNALNSLYLSENKTKFDKALTSRIDNIQIENYANSILPLDLANFHLSDVNNLPKM